MTDSGYKTYETHFEVAKTLGASPARIKRLVLNAKMGPYGSSGGVLYFPTDGKDMTFFDSMTAIRHSW